MTRIEVAIRHQQWELVWLYVLLGVSDAAARLPAESLTELLDVLGGEARDEDEERRGRGNAL